MLDVVLGSVDRSDLDEANIQHGTWPRFPANCNASGNLTCPMPTIAMEAAF